MRLNHWFSALALASFASGLLAAQEYVDAVAAKVNRTVITKSQVDRKIGAARKTLTAAQYEQISKDTLLRLVYEQIEADAVVRVGLVVPKRLITERVEEEKEKKGAAEVLEGIKEAGYKTEEEYVESLGQQFSRQTYVAAQSGQYGSRAPQFRPDYWTEPTIQEIRQYYRQHPDEFLQKNQARTYVIFLPYAELALSRDDLASGEARAKDLAGSISAELKGGADVEALARRYSRGPNADAGGDFGWQSKESSLQRELLEYALTGPVREPSPPILYPTTRAPRGLAIVWVAERVEERMMPFAEAQTKIRDGLRDQRVDSARRKFMHKLIQEAYISPDSLKRELLRGYQQ